MAWHLAAFWVMSEETFELDPWECWESGEEACIFLCIPDSKYFTLSQNCGCSRHSCEILCSLNYLPIMLLPPQWRVSFASVCIVTCVRELCSCLCVQWTERDKGCEWWEAAFGEKPLSNIIHLPVKDLFLTRRTVKSLDLHKRG